jgi:hypothetical protein
MFPSTSPIIPALSTSCSFTTLLPYFHTVMTDHSECQRGDLRRDPL